MDRRGFGTQGSLIVLALALAACGADGSSAAETAARPRVREPRVPDPVGADDPEPPAMAEEHPAPVVEPADPEPEPVIVEAGVRLGPIRVGMSEDEVRALGLVEAPHDPRSRRFGPYRVSFDARGVRRVEALVGQLGRIQIDTEVLPAGTHIHRIRDVIGSCEWVEGGGERYRCANGALFVQTTHTMDPARYAVAVERR